MQYLCYTHTRHCPAKPRQGLQVVSHWTMNNALNEIVLTSQCVGGLENVPMEVWGAARKAARKVVRKVAKKGRLKVLQS